MSPDGKLVVYSPTSRDFRTWKRYQGGWAQDLFIVRPRHQRGRTITKDPRTDRDPMWIGDAIYFNSDRDGHLNLYVHDLKAEQRRQADPEYQYDVRWPSERFARSDRLRSERRAAGLRREIRAAPTRLRSRCRTTASRCARARVAVDDNVEDFELSPKGERALFVARGDIFTLPIEKGPTRNLTHYLGRAREVGALVAGRQADRVHLRQER